MTSRERVLTTLAHAEPDRVPINYQANPGIDARLKRHSGLSQADTGNTCDRRTGPIRTAGSTLSTSGVLGRDRGKDDGKTNHVPS